jgi:tRNA(adenine34) deaminase
LVHKSALECSCHKIQNTDINDSLNVNGWFSDRPSGGFENPPTMVLLGHAWKACNKQSIRAGDFGVARGDYISDIVPMIDYDHNFYMEGAFKEALIAFEELEVPVGAVVVKEGRIIGRGHNRTEALKDATAHAEMLAITSAAEKVGDWRLDDCILYCTIEPCAMCAGAAVLSRIKTIVFGAHDTRFGACGSIFEVPTEQRLNHRIEIISGVMEKEALELMQSFFQEIRKRKGRMN